MLLPHGWGLVSFCHASETPSWASHQLLPWALLCLGLVLVG